MGEVARLATGAVHSSPETKLTCNRRSASRRPCSSSVHAKSCSQACVAGGRRLVCILAAASKCGRLGATQAVLQPSCMHCRQRGCAWRTGGSGSSGSVGMYVRVLLMATIVMTTCMFRLITTHEPRGWILAQQGVAGSQAWVASIGSAGTADNKQTHRVGQQAQP